MTPHPPPAVGTSSSSKSERRESSDVGSSETREATRASNSRRGSPAQIHRGASHLMSQNGRGNRVSVEIGNSCQEAGIHEGNGSMTRRLGMCKHRMVLTG